MLREESRNLDVTKHPYGENVNKGSFLRVDAWFSRKSFINDLKVEF